MDSEDYSGDATDIYDIESYEGDMDADDEEVDDMLDALLAESDEDYAERRRGGRRGRGRRGRGQRRGVPTATGRSAYRPPATSGFVTQKQFQDAMGRVGAETKRNAEGIKTVNTRLGTLDGRVSDVVSVTKAQSGKITSLDTRMRLDGALDFAQSVSVNATTGGLDLDISQILKGVVKNGVLGEGKGALSNPWLVGGVGLALRPGLLGAIFK